jgi:hypothetical protein
MLPSHATLRPRKTLMLFASTHRFLNHPQYCGRVVVVALGYEVPHPFSDKRLYPGVDSTVVQ